jgi:hypothetical protein
MLKLEEGLMDRVLGAMDKTLPEQAQIFSELLFVENYEYEDEGDIGFACKKDWYRRCLEDIIGLPEEYGLEFTNERVKAIKKGAKLTKAEQRRLHPIIFDDLNSLHAAIVTDGHRRVYALVEMYWWECSRFMGFFASYSDATEHLERLDEYVIDPLLDG